MLFNVMWILDHPLTGPRLRLGPIKGSQDI